MTDTARQTEPVDQSSSDSEGKKAAADSYSPDPKLQQKINEALAVPIPEKDDFWVIKGNILAGKQKKVLGLFKRKTLGAEETNELRKNAQQSPGNTRTKIQKLKRQYPDSPVLNMLAAICTYGMLLNSSNQAEVIRGLKVASKEAATALISDGISVYNCENFFRIYFTYIDRMKRQQGRTLDTVKQDPRLDSAKHEIELAMQIVDQMATEKNKIQNVLNHLKKKLKSKQYTTVFEFTHIREAGRHIELGNPKEKCSVGVAAEIVVYIYALAVAFARIPVLTTLVDYIISLFPESNLSMLLRRISIDSVRNFARFRLATISGETEKMAKLGKLLVKENMVGIQKLDGQSLYQSYETDPFFNLAFVAEMTPGLYSEDDHGRILRVALQAVESVIKRDMSKNHAFTESAKNHTHKLTELKESAGIAREDKTQMQSLGETPEPT